MRETMLPGRDAAPRMTSYEDERARFRIDVPERFNAVLDILERWAADAPDDAGAACRSTAHGETVAEQTVADLAARVAAGRARAGRRSASARATRSSSCCRASRPGTRRCSAPSGSARSRCPAQPADAARHRLPDRARRRRSRSITDADGAARSTRSRTTCRSLRTGSRWGAGEPRDGLARPRRAAGRGRRRRDARRPDARTTTRCSSTSPAARSSYPKMVLHTQSYGLGHIRHGALLARPAAGRPPLDRLRHGLGQGGLGRAVRPVARARERRPGRARQARRRHDPRRSSRATASPPSARRRRSTGCSCRPTSPAYDLSRAAPLHQRRRAAQPRGHPRLAGGHRRPDGLRRLRPDRDDVTRGQLPRRCRCGPGSMGKPVPGLRRRGRSTTTGEPRADGEVGHIAVRVASPRAGRPVRRLLPRRRGRRPPRFRDGWYFTGDKAPARRRRLPLVRGPRRRRHHVVGLPHRPVRGRVGADRAPGRRRGGRRRARTTRSGRRSSAPSSSSPPATRPRTSWPRSCRSTRRQLTAPYKYPREIHFVDELPKTVSGKIRRAELRAELNAAG